MSNNLESSFKTLFCPFLLLKNRYCNRSVGDRKLSGRQLTFFNAAEVDWLTRDRDNANTAHVSTISANTPESRSYWFQFLHNRIPRRLTSWYVRDRRVTNGSLKTSEATRRKRLMKKCTIAVAVVDILENNCNEIPNRHRSKKALFANEPEKTSATNVVGEGPRKPILREPTDFGIGHGHAVDLLKNFSDAIQNCETSKERNACYDRLYQTTKRLNKPSPADLLLISEDQKIPEDQNFAHAQKINAKRNARTKKNTAAQGSEEGKNNALVVTIHLSAEALENTLHRVTSDTGRKELVKTIRKNVDWGSRSPNKKLLRRIANSFLDMNSKERKALNNPVTGRIYELPLGINLKIVEPRSILFQKNSSRSKGSGWSMDTKPIFEA